MRLYRTVAVKPPGSAKPTANSATWTFPESTDTRLTQSPAGPAVQPESTHSIVTPALRYTSLAMASAAASSLGFTPAKLQTITGSRRGADASAAYAAAGQRNRIAI